MKEFGFFFVYSVCLWLVFSVICIVRVLRREVVFVWGTESGSGRLGVNRGNCLVYKVL